MNKNELFRNIPKVDAVLELPFIKMLTTQYDRYTVVEAVREQIEKLRVFISECGNEICIQEKIDSLLFDVKNAVLKMHECSMKPVINATGTILHTNLGRAPISEEHAERLMDIMTGYSNLEYNLKQGERGERYSHFEELLCKITGAEAAIAVNNNAAAVLLILGTIGKGKEVIVSRGELVEIGGKFRIPDVMEQSGSKLVEVGTTNKTHLSDYEDAITQDTAALLKVHTSNYKIVGFTESVSVGQIKTVADQYNLPVIEDIGSGVLIDLSKYGLSCEPTVQKSIQEGADIVCFSGDKLLGGPQAGIIAGKRKYIAKMKKNPLMRTIRIDKFTAAALELTFHEYLSEANAVNKIPVLQLITKSAHTIRESADELLYMLDGLNAYADIALEECESQIGGGALPMERLKSVAVTIRPYHMSVVELEKKMRNSAIPVIVRVSNDKIYLDMRTISDKETELTAKTLCSIIKGADRV